MSVIVHRVTLISYPFQDFILKKKDYLATQVGNPEGADKPNKKVTEDGFFGLLLC